MTYFCREMEKLGTSNGFVEQDRMLGLRGSMEALVEACGSMGTVLLLHPYSKSGSKVDMDRDKDCFFLGENCVS
jgi:hypothetical protein